MSGIDGEAATVAATEAASVQRIEIVGERRRVTARLAKLLRMTFGRSSEKLSEQIE